MGLMKKLAVVVILLVGFVAAYLFVELQRYHVDPPAFTAVYGTSLECPNYPSNSEAVAAGWLDNGCYKFCRGAEWEKRWTGAGRVEFELDEYEEEAAMKALQHTGFYENFSAACSSYSVKGFTLGDDKYGELSCSPESLHLVIVDVSFVGRPSDVYYCDMWIGE